MIAMLDGLIALAFLLLSAALSISSARAAQKSSIEISARLSRQSEDRTGEVKARDLAQYQRSQLVFMALYAVGLASLVVGVAIVVRRFLC